MSHIVTCKVELKNEEAIARAIDALNLTRLDGKTHRLYSGAVTGIGVKLPGWTYPIVIDTETGELRYDNFNGCWGQQSELDKFVQRYSVEVTCLEAARQGHTVQVVTEDNGDVQLRVQQVVVS